MAVSDESAGKPKPDWLAIRRQYESSDISQRDLARLLGISESTMMKRAMREKWKQNAKLVQLTANDLAAEIDKKVKGKLREELAPWIEEQRVRFTKRGFHVADRGMNRVVEMMDSTPDPDAKEEAFISKAAETYHRIGRVALGMSDGTAPGGSINLSILTNQAAVQVVSHDS